MHEGAIVAMDTPAALLGALGREILEVRVAGNPTAALLALRGRGIAGDDAFTVASSITVPLHQHTAADALRGVEDAGVRVVATATRPPSLDDVYLRLTGTRLDLAA
jgi:ABC-type multidrug transport system ATPase subunit